MQIRNATSQDRGVIESLLVTHKLPIDGVGDHLADFLIAEDGGRIAGVIGLERYGAFGLLRSAAVSADARGRGIGSELVKNLFERAQSSGVRELYLLTTTAEDYFPRFGFQRTLRADVPEPVKASAEFRGACPDTAIVMRRVLPDNHGGFSS